MFIKRKHRTVILFSSAIIVAVFLSTIIGYSLYIQLKKDSFSSSYRNSIYEMTAELFKNDIEIVNIGIKIGRGNILSEIPFVEGTLKNNSEKTIRSMLLEVSFTRPSGEVIYKDRVYPLWSGTLVSRDIDIKEGEILLPGESISFQNVLKNCPRELVEEFLTQTKFAKGNMEEKMKFICLIKGLMVA
ncbi:MAG: hypothetical protein KAI70_02780 [Candidatus Omnitrophica bacterium]|nr:hypothetical protein [Candidatus Omnitrophota bacterium]